MVDNSLLVGQIIGRLQSSGLWLATAESCTGGLIAAALTEVPGSSNCFGYGLVTYSNRAKEQLLQVPPQVLQQYGAVSAETACAMAAGVRELAAADLGLSVTGIAGPGGATMQKPVGLVYLALATPKAVLEEGHNFAGNRQQVRAQTLQAALQMVKRYLEQL